MEAEKLKLLSQTQTAKLLGVSERSLYNMRRRGKLRAVKLGERVLYDPEDVKAFLENCKDGA